MAASFDEPRAASGSAATEPVSELLSGRDTGSLRVTMVKKRLASGEPCAKCGQAEDMLRRRQLWERIDHVVWADESDPSSEGMQLAERHQVTLAPFFLVERDGAAPVVLTSALQLVKELSRGTVTGGGAPAAPRQGERLIRDEVEAATVELEGAEPQQILDWALARLGADCGVAFSGAEDVVLIDMAVSLGRQFSVFCLDTGRLHPETYRFIDRVRKHYGIEIELVSPDPRLLQPFVRKKGLFSFYDDGHAECCGVRKVEPLRRALGELGGWATGQRRDQSPTRTDVPVITWDVSHVARGMLKVNPLARWSLQRVWEYIRERNVPFNELHERGYVSIGCEPCTRAIRPGEHERAGRWWWEEATQRECGLHKGPAPQDPTGGRPRES
jgi:phosphoadenosine phosphosulfate reductase